MNCNMKFILVLVSLPCIVSVYSLSEEAMWNELEQNHQRLEEMLGQIRRILRLLEEIKTGRQQLNQPIGPIGHQGPRGPQGARGPARGSKSHLVRMVMKDMGLEHMQTSMLDQKRSLQELSVGIHNIKSMRSEVIVSLERLKSDIENHMASIKTEVDEYRGDPGDEGYQGRPGVPGLQGITGVKGSMGLQGDVGEKGRTGSSGLDGLPGEDGIPGQNGLPGEKGDKGDTIS